MGIGRGSVMWGGGAAAGTLSDMGASATAQAFAKAQKEPEHVAFLERHAQPEIHLDSAACTKEAAETFRREGEILRALWLDKKE